MTESKKKQKLEQKVLRLAAEKRLTPSELRNIVDAAKHPSSYPVKDLSEYVVNNRLTIGLISDTCLNSKYARLDILHTVYDLFKKFKVSYVLHCGNITEGYAKGATHVEHILCQDYDGMLDYIGQAYPKIGVPTYFIGGRNERSFFKRLEKVVADDGSIWMEKTNVCMDLDSLREDLNFLGWHNAKVRIAPKTTLALVSPKNGSRKPYTISHPIQKIIESYGGGEKPDIQVVGYYNQRWSGIHLGVNAIMIGTTQNQPPENYSDAEPSHNLGALLLQLTFKNGSLAENGIKEIDVPFYD
ncbi:hypothetical protein J4479_04155 [Candidatus Woesearchaeota archaeon]|nr:hypothetical protein [Candidatus Woesearchaeota archaeon]